MDKETIDKLHELEKKKNANGITKSIHGFHFTNLNKELV